MLRSTEAREPRRSLRIALEIAIEVEKTPYLMPMIGYTRIVSRHGALI